MDVLTREATREDLVWVRRAALAAHLFESAEELEEYRDAYPWAVRVTSRAEAVVLGRWRSTLDILAIRGLWCSEDRVPALVADLCGLAARHGFEQLLGPLVPEREIGGYAAAGLEPFQRVVVLCCDRLQGFHPPAQAPGEACLRPATPDDVESMFMIDSACFEPFWAYDSSEIARYVRTERTVIATIEGKAVGYTLATMRGDSATVGRLAVLERHREHGIGGLMLADCVKWARESGAVRVTLCTQESNEASRRLYRDAGFRELPGRLVAAISGPLQAEGADR